MIVRRIDSKGSVANLFVDLMRDSLIEWGLLIGAGIPLLPLGLSIGRKGDTNVTQT
jgi:hypothetical protein